MKIEFNKVTWYSKLAAVVVLVGTIFLAWYFVGQFKEVEASREAVLSSSLSPSSSANKLSKKGDIVLMVGESTTFDNLKISFNKVIQDSRCPIGAECFSAGNVTASVTLSNTEKTEEKNLISGGTPYVFGGYSISITRVTPTRNIKTQIDPQNYIAVFHIAKN